MMQLLQAVVRGGTATAAAQLKHPLGGKTGTTNNYTDAWFIGFSPSITCGTWMGYDNRQSLGEKETGARAALPIWSEFMRAAIAEKPNEAFAADSAPKKAIAEDNGAPVKAAAPANAAANPATKPAKPVADRSFWVSKPPRGIK
jgi:penicillin-binding protein 1A